MDHHVNENGSTLYTEEGRPVALVYNDELEFKNNASHLARCWNLHDNLVAALESFVSLLPSDEGLGGHAPMGAFFVAGHKARKVLAKAKGA